MPDCVLRVAGSTTKMKKFLAGSTFEPTKVYFRGEPGIVKSRGTNKISGFNVSLSGSHGTSIEKQARQAIKFMEANRNEFTILASFKFKFVTIDFGLNDLATKKHPWPCYRLPKRLVELAAEFGFDIELSFYGKP